MLTAKPNTATSFGLLVLRVGIGGYMLTHGWGKLQMLIDGQFDALGDPIGIGGAASLSLVVFAEFVCSLLVILGLLTRLATLPLMTTMAVAAFMVHGSDPWTMEAAVKAFFAGETQFPASKQPALIYLFAFAALLFTGAGRFSIDALIFGRKSPAGDVDDVR